MANAFTNVEGPAPSEPVYAGPLNAYAVPNITEDVPFADEFGWAAENPGAARDTSRMGFSADPSSTVAFHARRGGDVLLRHTVEDQDADGWQQQKGSKRFAQNPRSVPVPESRPTQQMAPRSYTFTRPFAQHAARLLNGVHFSMADHRRTYPILGMQPVTSRRNTYRIDPVPWDTDIVDLPPENNGPIPGRIRAVDIPPSANRSWRLG
jgi:hypothetical protein